MWVTRLGLVSLGCFHKGLFVLEQIMKDLICSQVLADPHVPRFSHHVLALVEKNLFQLLNLLLSVFISLSYIPTFLSLLKVRLRSLPSIEVIGKIL
jgi:hypothetical protein